MTKLSRRQQYQENQYTFPYHYSDLGSDFQKFIANIEYLDLLQVVKKACSPFCNQKILDVGCGDGRLCYELKKEKCQVSGVDYSKHAISFARAFNPKVDFFLQNIEKLKIAKKFDIIIAMETLEHFLPSKIPIILSNLANILKKDGKLIITVPSKNLPTFKKHYQHFTAKTITETIKPYFRITKISGYRKISHHRKILSFLRKIGYLVYPFRNKYFFAKRFFKFMNEYYKKNISLGNPEECDGLIVVCVKSESSLA